MAGQILVPLSGSDRIELFLPYVKQIAQPGMKVVFLVHLGASRFKELTNQLLAIHTGIQPAFLPGQTSEQAVVGTQGVPPSSEFSLSVRVCAREG